MLLCGQCSHNLIVAGQLYLNVYAAMIQFLFRIELWSHLLSFSCDSVGFIKLQMENLTCYVLVVANRATPLSCADYKEQTYTKCNDRFNNLNNSCLETHVNLYRKKLRLRLCVFEELSWVLISVMSVNYYCGFFFVSEDRVYTSQIIL